MVDTHLCSYGWKTNQNVRYALGPVYNMSSCFHLNYVLFVRQNYCKACRGAVADTCPGLPSTEITTKHQQCDHRQRLQITKRQPLCLMMKTKAWCWFTGWLWFLWTCLSIRDYANYVSSQAKYMWKMFHKKLHTYWTKAVFWFQISSHDNNGL